MNKVSAIFYDLDNTIYPQLTDIIQRIDYCVHKFSFKNAVELRALWISEWRVNGPAKSDIIDRLIDRFNLEADGSELLAAYRGCRTQLLPDEEVCKFLLRVRNLGIRQFLITNGHARVQHSKISSLGLEGLFDEIIVAEDERRKPSTYWFKKLLEEYALPPDECLSIGDWYAVDGAASVGAGISFLYKIGGPVTESVPPEAPRINKITEIEKYLHD